MEEKRCRSKSPLFLDGEVVFGCCKRRGHKDKFHTHPNLHRRWEGGINTPAIWELKDDEDMSETDWQTWGRWV